MVGHLDADCFYVSAERVRHPDLVGKPVGVLGNNGACVIAKSYEMKARGVKTGTPIWDAKRLCPTDRRNAVGAGAPPRLTLADGVLASMIMIRFGAKREVGMILGVSLDTIVRVARRLKPILSASSAIGLLVPLTVPERQASLLLASRQLPHYGGYLRLLGYRCSIWLDDHGGVWPIGRVGVLAVGAVDVQAEHSGELSTNA